MPDNIYFIQFEAQVQDSLVGIRYFFLCTDVCLDWINVRKYHIFLPRLFPTFLLAHSLYFKLQSKYFAFQQFILIIQLLL